MVSFGVKGGRAAAMHLMNSLKLARIVTHVADARTSGPPPGQHHPPRQLTEPQLAEAGIGPEFIRFSVGIEDVRIFWPTSDRPWTRFKEDAHAH